MMNWQRSVHEVSKRSQEAGRAIKWLSPNMGVKRYIFILVLSLAVLTGGFLHFVWTGPFHIIATKWILFLNSFITPGQLPLWAVGLVVTLISLFFAFWSVWMLNRSLLSSTGTSPADAADRIYNNRALAKGPHIVAIGGGTGLSNLLASLKEHSSNITAVVAVTDDGGSSGKLRHDLGMIAPGDLTDCFAALSDSPVLAHLLLHRFSRGEGLTGHTFGNLLLATLSEERGSLEGAVQDVNAVLNVRGQVLPATFESAVLIAELDDGREVIGESQLHLERNGTPVTRMRLEPAQVAALPEVLEAIADADLLLVGPGSLFTSLIPPLLVPEVAQSVRNTKAPLVYIANIMSEAGETDGMSLEEHHRMLAKHIGREADIILVNNSPIHADIMQKYQLEGAELLTPKGCSASFARKIYEAPLVSMGKGQHNPLLLNDALMKIWGHLKNKTLKR